MPQEEPLETGNSFTTNITSTTTFYAEAGACESGRLYTVNPLPALPLIGVSSTAQFYIVKMKPQYRCQQTPSLDCRLNYTPNGGTANSTNPPYYSNRHNILLCESNKYLNRL
jgi:hypothetical protein